MIRKWSAEQDQELNPKHKVFVKTYSSIRFIPEISEIFGFCLHYAFTAHYTFLLPRNSTKKMLMTFDISFETKMTVKSGAIEITYFQIQ